MIINCVFYAIVFIVMLAILGIGIGSLAAVMSGLFVGGAILIGTSGSRHLQVGPTPELLYVVYTFDSAPSNTVVRCVCLGHVGSYLRIQLQSL